MEGKVVFQGKTEDGLEVLIRYIKNSDAKDLNEYINILSKEKTFISYQGAPIPISYEEKYIQEVLEKFKNHTAVHLLVFCEGKLIGSSDLHLPDPKREAIKRNGHLGISILKEYRNKKLGKLLMGLLLDEAVKNLPDLKIITLGVMATNTPAIKLYKSFGFMEYGRLPEAFFHKGEYIDEIRMYKKMK